MAYPHVLAPLTPSSAAVLLAAGGGTRFAGTEHKLLTTVGGRLLIEHAVGNVTESGLTPILVVTGAADLTSVLPTSVVAIVNEDWESGQATSLAVAVDWARSLDPTEFDAIVVGLADQPGISPSAWRAVAATTNTPMAVATYGGVRGHPVRLHRDVWDRLPRIGDAGARPVMARWPELVTEVACDGDPSDVDTVEDLRHWPS